MPKKRRSSGKRKRRSSGKRKSGKRSAFQNYMSKKVKSLVRQHPTAKITTLFKKAAKSWKGSSKRRR